MPGLASGLVNTTAQIGGALGLAVPATISASRSSTLIAQHHPAAVLRPQPSLPPAPELVPAVRPD